MTPTETTPQINMEALGVLRKKVEAAVREIRRLRQENSELRAQVESLEAEVQSGSSGLAFAVDDASPEELKERIQGFIQTIDAILGEGERTEAVTNGHTT